MVKRLFLGYNKGIEIQIEIMPKGLFYASAYIDFSNCLLLHDQR